MPVRELLDRIDSPEIAEWMAFEKAFGPIGNEWRDQTLAGIHDQLQILNHVFVLANFEDEPDEPQRLPRPHQLYDVED